MSNSENAPSEETGEPKEPDAAPRPAVDPLFDKPPPSRVFRIVRRILLVVIAFAILLLAGVSVLSLVGGKDDSLRIGLEKFFHDYTGMKTTIGTLNDLQIYPALHMDIENLTAGDPDGPADTAITARRMVVGMDFWDAVFSRGWIAASRIEGLSLPAGFLTPRAIEIETLAFEGQGRDSRLAVRGIYNALPFALSVAMRTRPSRHGPLYRIADPAPFTLTLGTLTLQGKAARTQSRKGMDFPELVFSTGPNTAPMATGSGQISRTLKEPVVSLHLRATPDTPSASELNARLKFSDAGHVSGVLALPLVRAEDLSAKGAFGPLFVLVRDLVRPPATQASPSSDKAPEPQSLGTLDLVAGIEEGVLPILPSPGPPVRCVAGTLTIRTDQITTDPLVAYGRDSKIYSGKGAVSTTTGTAQAGWTWSLPAPSAEDTRRLVAQAEGLLPPSTPCVNLSAPPAP
ncbi:MAG TPA: hypothetical protein PKX87_00320 [Alphaproteobacteria bacterium]|nr:hypothetical protein [Alphaproteobacteria bacterium]